MGRVLLTPLSRSSPNNLLFYSFLPKDCVDKAINMRPMLAAARAAEDIPSPFQIETARENSEAKMQKIPTPLNIFLLSIFLTIYFLSV
jgi:hypothetical protein